jgi:hypothetical protein
MYANGRALRGLTHSYTNAGVAAGTTTTTTTTANTSASINGKWATAYASASNAATPTTDANSGAAFTAVTPGYGCALVYGVNAAGALKLAQGPQVLLIPGSTSTTSGTFNDAPQFPPLPDDFAPIAYVLVRTATGSSAWTPGTSNWTATGVTATFVNVAALPDRPQTS